MTKNEFRQQLVLRYLGRWIDTIEDSTEVVNYDEDGDMRLNDDARDVVRDAYDVAECVTAFIEDDEPGFFV